MRGDVGEGNGHAPCKTAVEDEGQQRLTARSQSEIDRVRKGKDRHRAGDDEEHRARELLRVVACIVEFGDETRAERECSSHNEAGGDRKCEELPDRGFCLIHLVRTEMLTEDDRDRAAHREANDVEEIEYRG